MRNVRHPGYRESGHCRSGPRAHAQPNPVGTVRACFRGEMDEFDRPLQIPIVIGGDVSDEIRRIGIADPSPADFNESHASDPDERVEPRSVTRNDRIDTRGGDL